MKFLTWLKNKVQNYIIKQYGKESGVDIVEVRTKEYTLSSVITETDIKIKNKFFIPFTVLSIQTELYNTSNVLIGKMKYDMPRKVQANSEEIFTSTTHLSNITAIFNVIRYLITPTIAMRSIGIATIKILWFKFEIPIDDTFEIHRDNVKMTKELTAEEKNTQEEKRELARIERQEKKEEKLKRKYKNYYKTKEERNATKNKLKDIVINEDLTVEFVPKEDSIEFELDSKFKENLENNNNTNTDNTTVTTQKNTENI